LARKKSPERRFNLIEAAVKVFGEKGYSKATVSEIAREAGVAQGTFYIYFESKEDVLDTVAEHVLQHIVGSVTDISESPDKTAVEKVREIIRAWLELGSAPGPLIEELHNSRYAPLHDHMARKAIEMMLPPLTEIIRQGVSEGSMDVLYPEVTALHWVSVDFPTEPMSAPVGLDFDQLVEAYADYVQRLLGLKDQQIFEGLLAEVKKGDLKQRNLD
jgi:AcrR family transcriptional regulator